MKILVTGANGYIGSKIVKKLLDLNNQVIAVDWSDEHIDMRATIKKINIFDSENIYEDMGQPDVCLHLAWRDGFVHNSLSHMNDLSSHFIFLRNLIDSGIDQIAVMGSMHEAGYYDGRLDELTSTNPLTLYGIAKDTLRRTLSLYCKDKKVIFQWLRAFYIYGDDDFGNSIFCKIKAAVRDGKDEFPFTTGKNQFDFIHIDNLVEQISYTIMQKDIFGEINVCSGTPISLADKIEEYILNNKLPIKLGYGKFPDRSYDSPCIYGDDKKIKQIMEERK